MFGPPGTLYIYLVYGLHLMLNVVTGPPGSAVLIRSAGGVQGPGRLGARLRITGGLNGKAAHRQPACGSRNARRPGRVAATRASASTMRGKWSRRKLRFVLAPSNLPPQPAIRTVS